MVRSERAETGRPFHPVGVLDENPFVLVVRSTRRNVCRIANVWTQQVVVVVSVQIVHARANWPTGSTPECIDRDATTPVCPQGALEQSKSRFGRVEPV